MSVLHCICLILALPTLLTYKIRLYFCIAARLPNPCEKHWLGNLGNLAPIKTEHFTWITPKVSIPVFTNHEGWVEPAKVSTQPSWSLPGNTGLSRLHSYYHIIYTSKVYIKDKAWSVVPLLDMAWGRVYWKYDPIKSKESYTMKNQRTPCYW